MLTSIKNFLSALVSTRRRRILVTLAGLLLLFLLFMFLIFPSLLACLLNGVGIDEPYLVDRKTEELHKELWIADLHADSLLWDRDLAERSSYGHVDLPRMVEGNLALQAFTVVTKVPNSRGFEGNEVPLDLAIKGLAFFQCWPSRTWFSLKHRALYQAERLHSLEKRSRGQFRIIKSRPELEKYLKDRRKNPKLTAGFLGIEGAQCLEARLESLDALFEAGFRMIGPTHFFDTAMGGSAHGTSEAGLSDFGRKVVSLMEQKGMIVDLAHASPALIDDVLALAKKPVLSSHTGVRGCHDSVRNLSDRHLKGIAKTGGVIGIAFFEAATGSKDIPAIVKAIRYSVDLVGVDHVALGSDFDGSVKVPFHCGGMKLLTQELLRSGFKEAEIRKIMGENTLRVLRQALPPQ